MEGDLHFLPLFYDFLLFRLLGCLLNVFLPYLVSNVQCKLLAPARCSQSGITGLDHPLDGGEFTRLLCFTLSGQILLGTLGMYPAGLHSPCWLDDYPRRINE